MAKTFRQAARPAFESRITPTLSAFLVGDPDLGRALAAAKGLALPVIGTARTYAQIRDRLKSAGTPIPSNDLWIASLAAQHALPLLSRDQHFDLIPNVRRVGW